MKNPSTAADCRCVENNCCLNVVGKTLFNPGQWKKDTLGTVECPDPFETTNYCDTKQLNVCRKYIYRRLPQQCRCRCGKSTAAAKSLCPITLQALKYLGFPFSRL
jgi:hypothetical protein